MNDKKKIIFGAGGTGRCALNYYGADNVYCFVDNYKTDKEYCSKPVISFDTLCDIHEQYDIVIACVIDSCAAIESQLRAAGISEYSIIHDTLQVTAPRIYRMLQDECFSDKYPSTRNAIDIFSGSWMSSIPVEGAITGTRLLFDDMRIRQFDEACPVKDKKILELGPLECGHTYTLEKLGATDITSIEANSFNYLKCLIVKDIFRLSVKLLHGDFRVYIENCTKRYDIVVAFGVLYHMTDPIQLIYDISGITDTLFLWTHYYVDSRSNIYNFDSEPTILYGKYTAYRMQYSGMSMQETYVDSTFMGGSRAYSYWLEKNSIFNVLKDAGFSNVTVIRDYPDHPAGACFGLLGHKGG